MRKKEENQVQRKTVAKRNAFGTSQNHHLGYGQSNSQQPAGGTDPAYGRPGSTSNPPAGNSHHQFFGLSNQNGQSSSGATGASFANGQCHPNSGVGMNMRTRMKFQNSNQQAGHLQPRQRSNNAKGNNIVSAQRKIH